MPDSNFDAWKSRTVAELATRPPLAISPQQAERHTLYCLTIMAIAFQYWNGNKYGRCAQYPLNEPIPTCGTNPGHLNDDYLGHNIAALIVDEDGVIIDFDFNHNELFNSSVEHAESRLLRRVFSLVQIQDGWRTGRKITDDYYATALRTATLYTTLESCAQCSGIMALAQVKQVVFLQTDPGQYAIGNIMRNMTVDTALESPEPVPAASFGLILFSELNEAYQAFRQRPKDKAHAMVLDSFGNETSSSYTTSLTSFLCTKAARDIFQKAARQLAEFKPRFGDWKPNAFSNTQISNDGVLQECHRFAEYAIAEARRGTPHRA